MNLYDKARSMNERTFLGFQPEDFEPGGREQFNYLIHAGLLPDSKVVDLGCGVLRAGYWLIHFLKPGGYFGIEPHTQRLKMGLETVMDADIIEEKKPSFDTNDQFDTSVFEQKFDFFLAYSIWTHASKKQILLTLDAFIRDAKPDAVFLTTYLPATPDKQDYTGESWFGTSHESDVPGCINHSFEWIVAVCHERGLAVRELGKDRTYGQSWLEIRHV